MDHPRFLALVADPPARWRPFAAAAVAALAIGAAIAAATLHVLSSYSLIVAGVLAATWYAGLRFGLATLALAMALAWLFVAEPRGEFGIKSAEFFRLSIAMATAGGGAILLDYAQRGWRAAEKREARARELREEVAARDVRFSTIADALPVLIAYVNAERRYTFNNRAHETWFEAGPGEAEGKYVRDVLGDEAYGRIRGYIDQTLSGVHVSYEALVPYERVGSRWVHADYVPDFAPDGVVRGFFALVADQTERKRSEEALRLSEKRYRLLAEATTSVVWVTDAEARVVAPQPEWERYTGQTWPEYEGTGFLSMLHPEDRADLMERWQSALSAGAPQYFPARVWHADSRSWHHCDAFAIPLKEEDGEILEWIGATNDVEDRYRALELARANALKDEFVGLVSHELKTPVAVILGNAEILQRSFERMDAQSRAQALEDICADADHLRRIIDNMLMLARLDRGLIEPEPVIVPRVVDKVVQSVRAISPERHIIVESNGSDAVAFASADFVEEVVSNLLSNAMKYSPAHEPVEVQIGQTDGEVTMDVLDRGAGIAPEELDRIFEPFYRSPRTKASATGLGVGLSVCKRIVEAQHGRLWAQPREGGGSDFGFALPMASEGDL